MIAPSITTEAKRHKNRMAFADKVNAEPARAAIVNLLAAAKGLMEAECFEEARRMLVPTTETLSVWAYCLIRGKRNAPRFDATTAMQQLRQSGSIDKSTWRWAAKILSTNDAKPETVRELYDLARKLYALTGGHQVGMPEKTPRDIPEAFKQYRASCRDTPDNPRQTARLTPDGADRLPSQRLPCRKLDELEERPGDRLAESVRKELRRENAAARRIPTLEDADDLFERGQFVVAGIVAYAALLDRLRDAAFYHGCRPTQEPGTWERGFRPNQYGDALQQAGVYNDEDAATVRRLGVVGLSIATLIVMESTVIEVYIRDVREFHESHPSDYQASGEPWGAEGDDSPWGFVEAEDEAAAIQLP